MSDVVRVKFDSLLLIAVSTKTEGGSSVTCVSKLMFEGNSIALVETKTRQDAINLIDRSSCKLEPPFFIVDLKQDEILPSTFFDDKFVLSTTLIPN